MACVSFFIQLLGLSADAVSTTFKMLNSFTQMYPAQYQAAIQSFAQQYMVYLPQFSPPVLHAQAILDNGPDLLIFHLAKQAPIALIVYIIPVSFILYGGWRMRLFWTAHTKNSD